MSTAPNTPENIDPCVAEFLARHGIDKEEGMEVLDSIVQASEEIGSVAQTIVAPQRPEPSEVRSTTTPIEAAPIASSGSPQDALPKRRESVDTMRQLRSVANSISVSISRSNLLREKLQEATRFLCLGLVSGLLALMLAYFTSSIRSVIFFAALFTLVLGLISTYRSALIMTKLNRIAKI